MPRRTRQPSRTARGPFAALTIDELLVANAKRPEPLPLTELPKYAGHAYSSIHVRAAVMLRLSRIGRDGRATTHPDNASIEALPDLPEGWITPVADPGQTTYSASAAAAQARALASATVGAALPKRLSFDQIVTILDSYIVNGGSGKDILTAIKTRLDLTDLSPAVGPPPPSTPAETIARLTALLREFPRPFVMAAIAALPEDPPCEATTPSQPPSSTPQPLSSSPTPSAASLSDPSAPPADGQLGTTSCPPPPSPSTSTPTPPSPASPPSSTS